MKFIVFYYDIVFYCSHYFIVVINATISDTPSALSIDNSALGPHDSTSEYYVAAVKQRNQYDPDVPYTLGNGENTTFEDTRYENVPITLGKYRYFVRAYTIGPVSQFYNIKHFRSI